MDPDVRTYLWDIQKAAAAILAFIAGMDARTFAATEIVHSAVERKFEIIGEALSQLAKLDPDLAARIPKFREIIAFRNVLIHGFTIVDLDRIWGITENSLPGLQAAVTALLDELGPP